MYIPLCFCSREFGYQQEYTNDDAKLHGHRQQSFQDKTHTSSPGKG